ncbi:hypothetical protein HOD61_03235 [archaeon]|jgi:hypothetical protein|nr:hypothetical protein [archaeon]
MGEFDLIIKELGIKQKSKFNMIELYRTLKEWFEHQGYTLFEKEYNDIFKKDKRNLKIKWEAQKEIDDYTKFIIGIGIKITDYKIITTKTEKLVSGTISMNFEGGIESDYEEKWSSNPLQLFFRGIYDKIINTPKNEKNEKNLSNNVHEVYNKTKFFLNMYKFK